MKSVRILRARVIRRLALGAWLWIALAPVLTLVAVPERPLGEICSAAGPQARDTDAPGHDRRAANPHCPICSLFGGGAAPLAPAPFTIAAPSTARSAVHVAPLEVVAAPRYFAAPARAPPLPFSS